MAPADEVADVGLTAWGDRCVSQAATDDTRARARKVRRSFWWAMSGSIAEYGYPRHSTGPGHEERRILSVSSGYMACIAALLSRVPKGKAERTGGGPSYGSI